MPAKHPEATEALTGEPVGSYSHPRHYSGHIYEGYMPNGEYWSSAPNLVNPWSSSNNNPRAIMDNEFRKRDQYRMVSIFFSSRRRHTSWTGDWSSDVCSSD